MFDTEKVHISQIRPGDTIFHDGHERTVCRENIKRDDFLGIGIFGDGYKLGTEPVLRCIIPRIVPEV